VSQDCSWTGLDISYNVRSTLLLLVPNCHRALAFSRSHGYARHADGYSFDERRRVPPEVADPSEREHSIPWRARASGSDRGVALLVP
jgi:hypothetical protein